MPKLSIKSKSNVADELTDYNLPLVPRLGCLDLYDKEGGEPIAVVGNTEGCSAQFDSIMSTFPKALLPFAPELQFNSPENVDCSDVT